MAGTDTRAECGAGIRIEAGGAVECEERAMVAFGQSIGGNNPLRVITGRSTGQADAKQPVNDQRPAVTVRNAGNG